MDIKQFMVIRQKRGPIRKNADTNSICIDSACCMNGQLALYFIEDDKEIYIDPKENVTNPVQPNQGGESR